jgi:protein tyrosine phosphatase (PTP) superfamily phosphohydrolase (DUF442 family)
MPLAALASPAPAPTDTRRRLSLRWVIVLVLAVTAVPVGLETYRVTFGANFHVVIPGRVYRCAQPSAESLDRMIAAHGIRTVVNLRGNCDPFPWYLDEARTTHRHNVSQEDICFSAGRLPAVPELRRLVDILDNTEYPILLHCRRGADRTGLAAVLVLLLGTDTPLQEARWQMNPRFGHVALGRTAQLDLFLDYYEDWLKAKDKTHSPQRFRHWALHEYCPGSCLSEIAFLRPPPTHVPAHLPTPLQLRVRNASILPWQLNPMKTAGTHLGCHIYDDHDRLIDVVKTGLRDGRVLPGQTVDFTLELPALALPGRYRVQIDMIDEQQCWFYQTGSQPLEVEVIVDG